MNFPFFIASRYIVSNKDSRLLNLISLISVIGIALGVATLIIALSVLRGFENTLTQKITDFDAHIKIRSYTNILPDGENYSNSIKEGFRDVIKFSDPNVTNLAIISFRSRKEGINIKGIRDGEEAERLKSNITEGKAELSKENTIVLGRTLATKLLTKVGDKITLFALRDARSPSFTEMPNIEKFTVTGIFESGMADYDNLIGYTGLRSAQNLFSMGTDINGIDIKLYSVQKVDSIAYELRNESRYPYRVNTIFEIHRNIFTWIDLQKKPIPIVLGLIILVAVFNIISALLMLVLEKTKSVGVLKSLGTKSSGIIRIFLYQGIYLSLMGIILGNFLAWILMTIQLKFDIIKVPSSVYFVTRVPIEIDGDIFLIISLITFTLSLLAAVIPSYFASRINPVTALRFE